MDLAALGLVCFEIIFTPSTMALLVDGITLIIFPSFPLEVPILILQQYRLSLILTLSSLFFYNTSGAKDTTFIKSLSLNSLKLDQKHEYLSFVHFHQ